MKRYELTHDEEDNTWDVVCHHDGGKSEAWGSFDTEADAVASILQHQHKHSTTH